MNKKIIFPVSIILAGFIFISAYAVLTTKSVAKISFPMGNVLVLKKGQKRMSKGTFNMNLYNGDKVKTQAESRCEIKFNEGSIVRIDEQSIYTIHKAEENAKKKEVESELSIGRLWANIKKLARSTDKWNLRGPSAVVAVRGTIYRMDANQDSSVQVRVYEGSVGVSPPPPPPVGAAPTAPKMGKPQQVQGPVEVQGPREVSMEEWFEIVKAQQQIYIKPDGSYQKSDFNLVDDSKSAWVKWNMERDKLIR